MALLVVFIVVCAVFAGFGITALIKFGKMDRQGFAVALKQVRELSEKGEKAKAQQKLLNALKAAGWDYQALVESRKAGRILGIEGGRNFWFSVATSFKQFSSASIEWVLEGFLLLGRMYEDSANQNAASTLYGDVLNYTDGYKDQIPRTYNALVRSKVYYRMAGIELANENYLVALLHHAGYILEGIKNSKLENNTEDLNRKYPYKGHGQLDEILKAAHWAEDQDEILKVINRCVNMELGRIFVLRAQQDLKMVFAARTRANLSKMDRKAAKEMLQGLLEEPQKQDESKEQEKEGVILL